MVRSDRRILIQYLFELWLQYQGDFKWNSLYDGHEVFFGILSYLRKMMVYTIPLGEHWTRAGEIDMESRKGNIKKHVNSAIHTLFRPYPEPKPKTKPKSICPRGVYRNPGYDHPMSVIHWIDKNTTVEEFYGWITKNEETCLNYDINWSDDDWDMTLLFATCNRDNMLLAKALINMGAYVNAICFGEMTALDVAIENGNLDLVKLLIEHGALSGQRSLSISLSEMIEGSLETKETSLQENELLLKENISSIRDYLRESGFVMEQAIIPGKNTLFRKALKNNDVVTASHLLSTGQINLKNFDHYSSYTTCTRRAAIKGHFDMVKLLVLFGGEIIENDPYNLRGEEDTTTAMAAREAGYPEIADFLEETQRSRMEKLKAEVTKLKSCRMFLLGLLFDKNSNLYNYEQRGAVKDITQHIVSFVMK